MPKQVKFAGDAIDVLGGTTAVAQLFAVDVRVVSNWRARGLPPDTYAVMAPMLAAHGCEVSPILFGQRVLETPRPARKRGRKAENGNAARRS